LVKRLFNSGMSQQAFRDWSGQEYWQGRFEHADTPWELGHPSTALFEAFTELPEAGSVLHGGSVVIPGCGTGSDALELARRGCRVTAIDWSPHAIARLRERAEAAGLASRVNPVAGNFFDVPPQELDAFAEHTFFCAIDPSQRRDYAARAARWVRPGGVLFGNFFILDPAQAEALPGLSMSDRGSGPPFASTTESLVRDLSPYFECLVLRRASLPEPDRRPGMEWIGIFRRRPA
jgi:SAM-dependent methyltransferase